MISSISTIFNKKIIDYVEEESESVFPFEIQKVETELIAELEELYEDYEEEELT